MPEQSQPRLTPTVLTPNVEIADITPEIKKPMPTVIPDLKPKLKKGEEE